METKEEKNRAREREKRSWERKNEKEELIKKCKGE